MIKSAFGLFDPGQGGAIYAPKLQLAICALGLQPTDGEIDQLLRRLVVAEMCIRDRYVLNVRHVLLQEYRSMLKGMRLLILHVSLVITILSL